MALRWRLFFLLISSLFGYLEWGKNQHSFLIEAELSLIQNFWIDPASILNPFAILPLLGQLGLLVAFLLKSPPRWLVVASTSSMLLLLGFMFLIGLFTVNQKIVLSTLPFVGMAVLVLRYKSN
jgi:hypothetical protein